jgi:predicted tellurium resistance membrane protein TerC
MELLFDPQAWVSFLTLAVLEIVLGIDNIIILALLVERLPAAQRVSARLLGSGFAMLTRIALLLSVIWATNLREPLFTAFGLTVSLRDAVLLVGGAFLVVQSGAELVELWKQRRVERKPGPARGYWLIILQIGMLDIVFSFDTVFTAVGLAKRTAVMVAAIVVSVLAMIGVSSAVSRFIDRHPTVKALALAFMVLVGLSLVAEAGHVEIPQVYLYGAVGVSAVVVWLNKRLRRRG